jgi:hypothetical protein
MIDDRSFFSVVKCKQDQTLCQRAHSLLQQITDYTVSHRESVNGLLHGMQDNAVA